jgi:hypothetical protein
MSGFITTVASVAVASVGYMQSRSFVSKKLRFVDQAKNPIVPVGVGVAAAVVATPIFVILPFVGLGTALIFGIAVAFGTRAGVKSFGHSLYP